MEQDLKKILSNLNSASNDVWQAEKHFAFINEKDECDFNVAIETLLHGIWNEIDAVILLIEKRPF